MLELEGVLVDTRADRRAALRAAVTATGIAIPMSDADLAAIADVAATSNAIRALATRAGMRIDETDVELATLRADRLLDDALARKTVLYPGVRDAARALAVRLRLVVVTRLPRHVAERVLATAGLDDVVTTTIAIEPDGDDAEAMTTACRAALARLQRVRPTRGDEVVAFVDDAADVTGARAAGLRTVAVVASPAADAWVAGVGTLTYDALVQLLARSGARPT